MARLSRRRFLLASTAAALASAARRRALAAPPLVAGVHAAPVDNPWNSRLQQALLAAQKRGEIRYVFSEGIGNGDYERALREYAHQGVDLIVGEADAVERAARRAAADYPRTSFLMGSAGAPAGSNFSVFHTWNQDATFLTGVIAGRLTRTGQLGTVAGYPVPNVKRLINAFRAGARDANPSVAFRLAYVGTWFDPPRVKEAALAQIDSGADVMFGERLGTADACKARGVHATASLIDLIPLFPGTLVASAVWSFGPILARALADLAQGVRAADYSRYSLLKYGGSTLVYDEEAVPAAAAAAALARQKAIEAGEFTVTIDDSDPS
jgi:basic membrane lipoprotein Med (substrate-binding protein (PBP1-ABC) superfamily)